MLHAQFAACPKPPMLRRCALAAELGLREVQVKRWFSTRRHAINVRGRRRTPRRSAAPAAPDLSQQLHGSVANASTPAAALRDAAGRASARASGSGGALAEEGDAAACIAAALPLYLRRSAVAALAAAPAAVLVPHGGLAAVLAGAYVRVLSCAPPGQQQVNDSGSTEEAYQLLPVRGCRGAGAALRVLLPVRGGVAAAALQDLSEDVPSSDAELTAATREAAMPGAPPGATHAQQHSKAAVLVLALAAAAAAAAATAQLLLQQTLLPEASTAPVADADAVAGQPPLLRTTPMLPPQSELATAQTTSANKLELHALAVAPLASSAAAPLLLPPPPAAIPQPAPAAAAAAEGSLLPLNNIDSTTAAWHYRTPKNGVHGPFSLKHLALFREHLTKLKRWATLHVWRTGQPEADAVLLTSLLP